MILHLKLYLFIEPLRKNTWLLLQLDNLNNSAKKSREKKIRPFKLTIINDWFCFFAPQFFREEIWNINCRDVYRIYQLVFIDNTQTHFGKYIMNLYIQWLLEEKQSNPILIAIINKVTGKQICNTSNKVITEMENNIIIITSICKLKFPILGSERKKFFSE